MKNTHKFPASLGKLQSFNRVTLHSGYTPLERMPNLAAYLACPSLYVKRDDCNGLAFGGNKVRQLEFYFGEAKAQNADTVLITGAVQSNFVRLAAAAASKLGMHCHIQLEERVQNPDHDYRTSGNVLIDHMLGATIHTYPHGEDEEGADRQLGEIAKDLRQQGRRPYIIPLGPGHPPIGALGYVVAAHELLDQLAAEDIEVNEIIVASGSGATHAGLLCGLRALGSGIIVRGICVRRDAVQQRPRLEQRCREIESLLGIKSSIQAQDIVLDDRFLAPGYGKASDQTLEAILIAARKEALMLDPTYTGKAMAGLIERARRSGKSGAVVFLHTGGTPAIFAYRSVVSGAIDSA